MKISISNNNTKLYESVLIFFDKLCGLRTEKSELVSILQKHQLRENCTITFLFLFWNQNNCTNANTRTLLSL